jgi:hypothetical protein
MDNKQLEELQNMMNTMIADYKKEFDVPELLTEGFADTETSYEASHYMVMGEPKVVCHSIFKTAVIRVTVAGVPMDVKCNFGMSLYSRVDGTPITQEDGVENNYSVEYEVDIAKSKCEADKLQLLVPFREYNPLTRKFSRVKYISVIGGKYTREEDDRFEFDESGWKTLPNPYRRRRQNENERRF